MLGNHQLTSILQQPLNYLHTPATLSLTTHQGKLALAVLNMDSTGDTAVISLLLHNDKIFMNYTIFL